MARPRTRDDALADRLLRAAVIMVDRGETVTTRSVAEAAGTNIAALGQLFGGRPGLMRAVALDGFDQLAAAFAAARLIESPADRLKAIARAHRDFIRDHPHLFDFMSSAPVRPADAHREGDLDGALACRDVVVEAVRSLIGRDEAAVYDAALGLTAVLEGLAVKERQGLLGRTQVDRDRVWESTLEHQLAGLAVTARA